jgi:hypothetical protein
VVDLLLVVAFVMFFHRSGGSLDELAAWFVRAVMDSLGGCGSSLARWCQQLQWWGRRHGPWAGDGVLLFVVTCSGLVVFLATSGEGEVTLWQGETTRCSRSNNIRKGLVEVWAVT